MVHILQNYCSKKYKVHGLIRRVALEDESHRLWRLRHLLNKLVLHPASLESYASLVKIIQRIKPDEVYHLGHRVMLITHLKMNFQL